MGEESLSTRHAESSRLGIYTSGQESVQNGKEKPNILIASCYDDVSPPDLNGFGALNKPQIRSYRRNSFLDDSIMDDTDRSQ